MTEVTPFPSILQKQQAVSSQQGFISSSGRNLQSSRKSTAAKKSSKKTTVNFSSESNSNGPIPTTSVHVQHYHQLGSRDASEENSRSDNQQHHHVQLKSKVEVNSNSLICADHNYCCSESENKNQETHPCVRPVNGSAKVEEMPETESPLRQNNAKREEILHRRGWSAPARDTIVYSASEFCEPVQDADCSNSTPNHTGNGDCVFDNSASESDEAKDSYEGSSTFRFPPSVSGSLAHSNSAFSSTMEPNNSIAGSPFAPRSLPFADHRGRHSSFAEPGPSCIALRNAVLALYRLDDFDSSFLADGYFSHVYKVIHKTTRDVMVLKMNRPETSVKSNVLREVQLMNKLEHPNVIRFKGVCVENGKLHALTEFCNAGSLDSLILNQTRRVEWRAMINLALDVARGMEYVHSQGYVHRDLTAVNILLNGPNEALRALVADFGLACPIPRPGGPLPDAEGNPYWRAPECLKEEWYDEKSDVFSMGIIACQMISRLDADPDVGLPRTSQFGLDYIRFAQLCADDTPVDFLKLAFTCCFMDPKARPSFSEVAKQLFRAWCNALPVTAPQAVGRISVHQRRLLKVQNDVTKQINLSRSLSDTGFKSACRTDAEVKTTRNRLERRARTAPETTDVEAAICTSPDTSSSTLASLPQDTPPLQRRITVQNFVHNSQNSSSSFPGSHDASSGSTTTAADPHEYDRNGIVTPTAVECLDASSSSTTRNNPHWSGGRERTVEVVAEIVAAEDPFYEPEEAPYQNPFVERDKMRSSRKTSLQPLISLSPPVVAQLPNNEKAYIEPTILPLSTPEQYPVFSTDFDEVSETEDQTDMPETPEHLRYSSAKEGPEQSTPKIARKAIKELKFEFDLLQHTESEHHLWSKNSPATVAKQERKSNPSPAQVYPLPFRKSQSLPASPLPERAVVFKSFMKESHDAHQELDTLAKQFCQVDEFFQADKKSGRKKGTLSSSANNAAVKNRRNTVMPELIDLQEEEEEGIVVKHTSEPNLDSQTTSKSFANGVVGDLANESPVGDLANESPVGNLANESPVGDLANESPVGDLANESPVGDLANESPVGDLANESPVGDLANESPVGDLANKSSRSPLPLPFDDDSAANGGHVIQKKLFEDVKNLDSEVVEQSKSGKVPAGENELNQSSSNRFTESLVFFEEHNDGKEAPFCAGPYSNKNKCAIL